MNQELYDNIFAGAQAEGKRIREAIEASGDGDRPLAVRPSESERYYLELDFRDGEVSLRRSFGDGWPPYVFRGDAAWYALDTATSQLALAALLEERADVVADLAAGDDDRIRARDQIMLELEDLGKFWIMDPAEFYSSDMPTGFESDDELAVMASAIYTCGPEILPSFDEDEALDWLKLHRDYAREEALEAA
jgi:hypothetical protein